ncbi:MAG: hypothetical protein P1U34_03070 [Coxiellaceae bacterium]|nr:hypothetical protein [Coxiellaceae bacterium]
MATKDSYDKFIFSDDELEPLVAEIKRACEDKAYDDLQSVMDNLNSLNNDCAIQCLAKLDESATLQLMFHELNKENSHLPLLDLMLKQLFQNWSTSPEAHLNFTVLPRLASMGLPKDPTETDITDVLERKDTFEKKFSLIASRFGEINSLLWQCNHQQLPYNCPLTMAVMDSSNYTFLQLKTLIECFQEAKKDPSSHEGAIKIVGTAIGTLTNLIDQSKPVIGSTILPRDILLAIDFTNRFFENALSNATSSIPGKVPLRTQHLTEYLATVKAMSTPSAAESPAARSTARLMPAPESKLVPNDGDDSEASGDDYGLSGVKLF